MCMAVEARRQCQGQADYDPTSVAKEMKTEVTKGKSLDLAEKKRSAELAGARPEKATKEKKKPVKQRTTVVSSIPEEKNLSASSVLTPAQLRNKHEYPQCTLENMKGNHRLSVINAEWFRTADGIPYNPDFRPVVWMVTAYGDKRMQFVAHLNAAIKHNEAIIKVWEEGV